MTGSGLVRRVELIGASTVLVGALCLGLAALEASIPALLQRLEATLGPDVDPALSRVREAFTRGAAVSAAVNLGLGAGLVAAGWGVMRRAPWSHAAVTVVCWVSIPALVLLVRPSLRPLVALTERSPGSSTILIAATAVLLLLQIGAVLWFLRFWRREAVRALFR